MKKLLLLVIPILALIILAAPVAADEEQGSSPHEQVTSEVEHGKSADAHLRNEDIKADSENDEADTEDEEVDSEDENVSEDEDEDENGAQRLQFYTVTGASSDNVTDEEVDGSVNVVAPGGDVVLDIQGNIKSGLEPNQEYEVWVRSIPGYTGPADKFYTPLNYYMLDTFTTNENGHGSFHINIRSEDLPAGTYDIQVAINVAQEIPQTVIATPKDPYLTVVVGSED